MEIATSIGGAILAPVFTALIDQLGSQNLLNYAREGKVLTELNKWKEMLEEIYVVLDDAEEQQMTNKLVKIWADKLRDLAYDVEDILDEFDIEARRRKMKAGESKVRKLIPSYVGMTFRAEMVSKIKEITARLEEIRSQKNRLDLRVIAGERSCKVRERRPTTSVVNKEEIYGRQEDKKAMLQFLNNESSDARVSVISITGMGGLGKTTLAQLLFNEAKLNFDLTAWVLVGDDFDVFRISQTIFQWIGGDFYGKDLNLLQVRLKEKLSDKKFLIVLDDVWNEKYEDWNLFRGPFEYGARGSRIIVTTRSERVSQMMGSVQSYPLKQLSYDDCLSVFVQHALGATNFDEHLDLKAIGEKIVERCQGLPLAAQAIGGVLRGERNLTVWEKLLSSDIWEDKTDVLPALRLSYHHLPSHLKRCFAYCAIFPKDYEFDENELVLQWMAEGFLQQQKEMKQMEELGHEYFQDLLLRSFFQQSTSNKSLYVMHDLINDLAQSISREVCFCLNLDDKSKGIKSYSKVRHSAFTRHFQDIFQRFEVFNETNNLRTFSALSKCPKGYVYRLASNVVHDLVPRLKRLRVLSLSGYLFEGLPNSVGDLKHLRYLNLSYTNIERLPKSLSNLWNLQTLKLCECRDLIELHAGIGNLINLMHLDLSGTHHLLEMTREIASLTNLQTLSKFIVGKGDGPGIKELIKFPNLKGQLQIEGLHNVVDIQEAELADLKKKEGLDELALLWTDNLHETRSAEDELWVLSFLQPHQKLGKLSIKFYGGKKFPSWIGDPSFTNMVDVELRSCPNITTLPPLGGLPKLSKLIIEGMGGVKQVGVQFYGDNSSSLQPFPSLETLQIENMLELKQWACSDGLNEAGNFPKLCELRIINCPKLEGKLPSCLPSLKGLNIEECQEMLLLSVPDLASLTNLKIRRISRLANLDKVVTQALVALKYLVIDYCDQLMCLWQDSTNLDELACLNHLMINGCRKLVSLVGGEEGLLPCNLEVLSIFGCHELENLPNGLCSLSSLGDLRISYCPKLVSFPARGLPYALKRLYIFCCNSLESMPESIMQAGDARNQTSHLEDLTVMECPFLASLPGGEFPHSVKSIKFCHWTTKSLESLDDRFSHLIELEIRDSPKLENFPECGLAIPNLRFFKIAKCGNLKSLPNRFQNLKSLTYLGIRNCGSVVSFPEGGLPPNLIRLEISYCENLAQPMFEWRLKRLTSLIKLAISGTSPSTDMVSFPDEEGQLLPSSLTFLYVGALKNLKSISRGLHKLTSLKKLQILYCPKLRSLPKEGLLAKLGTLYIIGCPLLQKRCTKKKGKYWPFIADIPQLEIH